MSNDIQKLKKVIDRKEENRSREEALGNWLYGRSREVRAAPPIVQTEFWCDRCHKDFETNGIKVIQFPKGSVPFAYYVGMCPCGTFARRRITDKLTDPYYFKSQTIRRQQAKFADDMLPPTHPRFKLLYPAQYAKLYGQETGIII